MFTEEEIRKFKNMPLLARSEALVDVLFQDKVDKANNHYMNHLLHVSRDFKSERKKSLAIMHDVLEDTSVTESDLKKLGYEDSFIETLQILTNTFASYEEYIDHILKSNNKDALEIKIKDLLHNMDVTRLRKITAKDLKRTDKYVKAYLRIIKKLEGEEL